MTFSLARLNMVGRGFLLSFLGTISLGCFSIPAAAEVLVYVGTYTQGKSEGIYQCRLDTKTGELKLDGLAAKTVNPSFLALHPKGTHLYAVNETTEYEGQKSGAITSFAIEPGSGKLKELNQRASGGGAPCHLVVDRRGRHVLVANYYGGSVGAWAIGKDGSLGERTGFIQHEGSSVNPRRQDGPHAHSINLDKSNRHAVAADLGLDKVLVYRFRAKDGSLEPVLESGTDLKPGSGPRHFAFHPNYRFAYVINEMFSSVTAFSYQQRKGQLREIQTLSTLPPGVEGNNSTAEVQVHSSGKFLYGSNRGHNSIAVFGIDQKTGKLTWVENESTQGKTPRNFGLDPTGQFLLAANQSSDTIVVFRIDQSTGALTPAGHQVEVPSPVCLKFLTP